MTQVKKPRISPATPKAVSYQTNTKIKKSLLDIEKQARSELKKNETESNNLLEKKKNLEKKLEEINQNLEKIAHKRKEITRQTREKIVQFARENY